MPTLHSPHRENFQGLAGLSCGKQSPEWDCVGIKELSLTTQPLEMEIPLLSSADHAEFVIGNWSSSLAG